MESIIHAVVRLGLFTRENDATNSASQLCTVDVKSLILRGDRFAIECQLFRVEKGIVRRLHSVLTCLVDLKDRITPFQNAKLVAFYRKPGTIDDMLIGIAPQKHVWTHDLLTIGIPGRDDTVLSCLFYTIYRKQ